MLGAGKATNLWNRIRRELKIRFEAAGITTCEFRYDGCWHNDGLGFAHADKRRYLTPVQLQVAALACAVCHDILERMPREEMRAAVMTVIANRICQP